MSFANRVTPRGLRPTQTMPPMPYRPDFIGSTTCSPASTNGSKLPSPRACWDQKPWRWSGNGHIRRRRPLGHPPSTQGCRAKGQRSHKEGKKSRSKHRRNGYSFPLSSPSSSADGLTKLEFNHALRLLLQNHSLDHPEEQFVIRAHHSVHYDSRTLNGTSVEEPKSLE